MAGKCFSRFKESSIAVYPFRLSDIAPYLNENMKKGSITFLVADMSVNKYFSENQVSDLYSIEGFLSFCDDLKEPFVQEFEIENDSISISVDDEDYIVIRFESVDVMRIFLENFLIGFNLYTSELFSALLQSVDEHFLCVTDGTIRIYKDYRELMESE